MVKLLAFIILLYNLFYVGDSGTLPASQLAEQTLITTLLTGYNKNIRPDIQVSVDTTATLQQIVSIDEKQQIMTSSSFIAQSWSDARLSWTPSAANTNIAVVMLPVKSLWIPDTMILNSADTSGYLPVSDYSLASVDYTGQVYMILPTLTIKTRCNLLVQTFPFDKQICNINLTSWSQGANRIIYTENGSLVVDTSEYSEHPLWQLNKVDLVITQATDRVPFEQTYNDVISIQLYLQRKPLFFIMNGIFACLILNCVTLLSYALSFSSQISLCMVCFMTYSVYSLNFSNLFPQQSQYIMMITLYFLLSICWTLISMAWFVICNDFTTKAEMPKPLYKFCGSLQRIFFCCFPPPKEGDKTNKTKDVILENGQSKESGDEKTIKPTSTQKMKCILCQNLFNSCLRRKIGVENIDKKEDTSADDTKSTKASPTETAPLETTACVCVMETNEKEKPKCNFCNRCESCQADFDKDKAKGKTKKDIEARCNALNYLVFIFVLLFMFISNMALWLLMAR